jgi:hypothetical protein
MNATRKRITAGVIIFKAEVFGGMTGNHSNESALRKKEKFLYGCNAL